MVRGVVLPTVGQGPWVGNLRGARFARCRAARRSVCLVWATGTEGGGKARLWALCEDLTLSGGLMV